MKRILQFACATAVLPCALGAQAKQSGAVSTKDAKIKSALSAAPASIGAGATVMDWPAKEGDKPSMLRRGTNGWTCFPDFPATEGNDPMCLDKVWMDWMDAFMAKKPPKPSGIGIGYMIAPGGASGSNTDPYAEKATATNEWGFDPPHLMVIAPDANALGAIPTKRQAGAPWVMWAGTPYVHVMIPVSEAKKP